MRDVRFHADTLLGFLAHGLLAIGIVCIALSNSAQIDINAYLFGDILSVSGTEIVSIAILSVTGLAILLYYWNALVLCTLEPTIAHVEGHSVMRLNFILVALLAATVALAIKIVGALLITALLIMPAAAARPLAKSPVAMACIAILAAWFSVAGGLYSSLLLDAPTGPMIVITAMVLCCVTMLVGKIKNVRN
jgi:zinc transport system permease protein